MFENLLSIFRKRGKSGYTFSEVSVGYDDERIWAVWSYKEKLVLAWGDLVSVAVETNNQGPFTEDVYWHLDSVRSVLTYPNSAKGAEVLLERLQILPKFNNEKLIEAMTCTENNTFILWDHQGRHE